MFAPIMTPAACDRRMMPELTKPTTITVVAEEDWITAVTAAPSKTAFSLLFCQFFKNPLQLAAGSTSQPFAHDMHAIQEQRQSAQHIQHVCHTHLSDSPSNLRFFLSCPSPSSEEARRGKPFVFHLSKPL